MNQISDGSMKQLSWTKLKWSQLWAFETKTNQSCAVFEDMEDTLKGSHRHINTEYSARQKKPLLSSVLQLRLKAHYVLRAHGDAAIH